MLSSPRVDNGQKMALGGLNVRGLTLAVWCAILYCKGYSSPSSGRVNYGKDRFLYLLNEPVDYNDALKLCDEKLATVEGAVIMDDLSNGVSKYLADRLQGCAWIGLRHDGVWRWANGEPFTDARWRMRQGDKQFFTVLSDCASICWERQTWKYQRELCHSTRLPSICGGTVPTQQQNRQTVAKAVQRKSRRKHSKVYSRTGFGHISGTAIFSSKVSAVTTCSRWCHSVSACMTFNYNIETFQCRGFAVRAEGTGTADSKWTVWGVR